MPTLFWDSHVHSHNSFDGLHSVEAICEQAFSKGLAGITITDHCDLGVHLIEDWSQRVERSVSDTLAAASNWRGRLDVSLGIELGQPLHDMERAQAALGLADFDQIIGAIHNVRNMEDFYYIGSTHPNVAELLNRYFEEQLELVRGGGIDVLAHLTYAYRYLGRGAPVPSAQSFEETLRLIFKEIANRGMALELNTSGIYRGDGISLPGLWELKLFRSCGGEYVTLGSDAHLASDVGKGFGEGLQLLSQAGFKYYTHFKNRKPIAVKI